jgi:hypothetical protein
VIDANAPSAPGRTKEIDSVLHSLTSLRGVVAAAIVDDDGFVTHLRSNKRIDPDAIGASVQIMLGAARQTSHRLEQGSTAMVAAENADGMMLLCPLEHGFALAIISDPSAMLGSMRFEVKELITVLNHVLG